jgi:hypothetical protein
MTKETANSNDLFEWPLSASFPKTGAMSAPAIATMPKSPIVSG